MINGKLVLAIIPARGGSKRVPEKNIREVGGKPLIGWTIEEAKRSKYIDRLILSSEDKEIIKVAKAWNCEVPFSRPLKLAQDNTPGIEPVIHAIQAIDEWYDYVVLLQPTSPLRKAEDIEGCIDLCIQKNALACVSVTEAEKNPHWMFTLDKEGQMRPLIQQKERSISRSQDLLKVYVLNGAVYIAKVDWFLKNKSFITKETIGYVMPPERSLDIDSELDIKIVSCLLEAGRRQEIL